MAEKINFKDEIIRILRTTSRKGIEQLIYYLEHQTDFFLAPASTKYHSNFEQGLSEHSYLVTELFEKKNKWYELGIPRDSVIICGTMHDLNKGNFYIKSKKNVKEGNKPNGMANWVEKEVWEIDDKMPMGHGSKSVILLQQFIELSEFEIMAILYHMGLPEEYSDKMSYNKALEKYPAIIALHTADEESSHLFETVIK